MAAKDLYEKDLYAILGVKKSDDDSAIKKQYRKLARELHPDKNKGDKKLEERFKEVSEAYEVLSDSKKRSEYDEMRDAFQSGRMPRGGQFGGGFQGADYSDMFGGGGVPQDIFSTLFGGARAPRKGQDLQAEITISFRNSIVGTEVTIPLNPRSSTASSVTTRIPAGIGDGKKIKVAGRGGPGQGGPGDLYIVVHVTKHPVFARKEGDHNLYMTLPITFTEAALGADIKVPTLDGDEVTVRIAPGTQGGKMLRVKGRGVKTTKHHGDLMITLEIQVPQRVEGKAKQALETFAAETAEFDPRADLAQRAKA
jgi:molecular chaperone DnaJ